MTVTVRVRQYKSFG